MACWMKSWLTDGSQLRDYAAVLNPTPYVQIMPADPYRYLITLPYTTATFILLRFGTSLPTTYSLAQSNSNAWFFLNRDDIGDLITLPLWGACGAGTVGAVFQTASYDPKRYSLYEQSVKSAIAKLGASGFA